MFLLSSREEGSRDQLKARSLRGQGRIPVEALVKKRLHVVGKAAEIPMLGDLVEATKIEANTGRLIHLDALSDTSPALCQLVRRATQFEVIDVNDQKETEILMPKTATPRLNGFEPHARKVSLAVLFPVAPRIGVTV